MLVIPLFQIYFKKFTVFTALLKDSKYFTILTTLTKHLFNDFNLNSLKTSNERYFKVAEVMKEENSGAFVFPDRDGSQYYGDRSMSFRDGVFAASLYTGVPILDLIVIESSSACENTLLEMHMWHPPTLACPTYLDCEAYALWRKEHETDILAYTRECQKNYFDRLDVLEPENASCALDDAQAVSAISKTRDAAIQRNLMARR